MSNENNSGGKQGEAGGGKGNNRRRYFRRRKPSDKGAESGPVQEPRKAQDKPQEQRKAQEPRKGADKQQEPRKPQDGAAKGRPRNQSKAEHAHKDDSANKGDRSSRGRRRRRRSRTDRGEETPAVQPSTLSVIDQEYIAPQSVFVYTYVLRPGHLSSHEFRPEHFSRVGRRLEDFDIDLSLLFPEEGHAKPKPIHIEREEGDDDEFADDYNYDDPDDLPEPSADETESNS